MKDFAGSANRRRQGGDETRKTWGNPGVVGLKTMRLWVRRINALRGVVRVVNVGRYGAGNVSTRIGVGGRE